MTDSKITAPRLQSRSIALVCLLLGMLVLIPSAQAVLIYSSQILSNANLSLGSLATEKWSGGGSYALCSNNATGSLDGTGLGLDTSQGGRVTVTNAGTGVNCLWTNLTVHGLFAQNLASPTNLYVSFLCRVSSTNGMGAGTNFFRHLRSNSGTWSNATLAVWIKQNGSGSVQLGATIKDGVPAYSATAIPLGQTFLVVARHSITNGADNDRAEVWVNPGSLGVGEGSVPVADAGTTDGVEDTSNTGPGRAYLNGYGGTFEVDEFRWANSWADVTPAGCNAGTNYTVTGGGAICPGDPGLPVGLSGSDSNIVYHLKLGGSDVGSPISGTGAAISFGLQNVVGSYTVTASNTVSACDKTMNGIAILSSNAPPNITSQPSPALATNTVSSTRPFSVTATGTALTYQWRHYATNLIAGAGYSGVTSNNFTISSINTNHAGDYDCIVNGTCTPPSTSSIASLVVLTIPGDLYRSFTNGNWDATNTWEQSSNGVSWIPSTTPPSSTASNITVQSGHTVTVNTSVNVDQVTVQSGATVSVANGTLTIDDGVGVDLAVAGTLQVDAGTGLISVGASTLQFQSGGQFNWNRVAEPAVPVATWQDGSTCRITQANTGKTSTDLVTGFTGQSFYDFVYDTTSPAQAAASRCRLNLQGATTIRRDFTITIPDVNDASVSINNANGSQLTVGRNVAFTTGTTTNNNKVLLANAGVTGFAFKVGGNFSSIGSIDGFGSAQSTMEFNGAGTQTLTLPTQPFIVTSGAMDWLVDNGSTVQLASTLDGFNTFVNNGTFNLGTNIIVRGTTLTFNPGGTVVGNGTNQLTFTNYISSLSITSSINTVIAGGTLSLPGLPTFAGGESFLLFQAQTHSNTFAAISPATPGASKTWDTTLLGTDGILSVVAASGPATNPTNMVSAFGGGNVTLSWPSDHIGWTLQTQTNSRSVGLTPATNTWYDVSGSTATNLLVIPTSSANPTVFYRLRLFRP